MIITSADLDDAYFAPWPILGVMRKPIAIGELLATVQSAWPARRRPRSAAQAKKAKKARKAPKAAKRT